MKESILELTAYNKMTILFLFSPENKLLYFMQIVSN